MDRLVCGDVRLRQDGVAIRAAFKVVEGRLSGRHPVWPDHAAFALADSISTFKERLQGFPLTVECINRFS